MTEDAQHTIIAGLLARVHAGQHRTGEVVHLPASDVAIADLSARAVRVLGQALPTDYAAFLRQSDGLDYDGLVIYDCLSTPEVRTHGFWQGFVVTNQLWRESTRMPGLLFVGDTGMDLLAAHPDGSYLRIDRVSDDVTGSYARFADLLAALLEPSF